ncbi:hypothetical protein [Microbacterium soli]|uniref:Uncharacterized protein n=1 Tax=Microbacterium soli TaxID=446075 RepID=A0ABP7MLZ7_9MICO
MTIEARGVHDTEVRLAENGGMPLWIVATTGRWWQSSDRPVTASSCAGVEGIR